jgi:hypothetical protein
MQEDDAMHGLSRIQYNLVAIAVAVVIGYFILR